MALSIKNVACVHVTNHHRSFKVDRKKIIHIVTEISRRLGVVQYEICVQFVSPIKMRALNKRYRKQDKSTDVLAFPQYDWKRPPKVQKSPAQAVKILNPLPLGDVVISPSDAAFNAMESGSDLAKEICFLVIHGILHLVGHDHMKAGEKRRMFSEQKKLMRVFAGGRSGKPTWEACARRLKNNKTKKSSTPASSTKRKRRK